MTTGSPVYFDNTTSKFLYGSDVQIPQADVSTDSGTLTENTAWSDIPSKSAAAALNTQAKALQERTNWIRANQPVVVTNVAALRALDKTKIGCAITKGYYTAGDCGAGEYWYDSSDTTSTDNGGTVILASDGGRWKLRYNTSPTVRSFGAVGNGVADDTSSVSNYLYNSSLLTGNYKTSILGNGIFKIIAAAASPGAMLYGGTSVLGGSFTSPYQNYYFLGSHGASNISIFGTAFSADSSLGGNDAMAATHFESGDSDVYNISVINSSFQNTSWGSLITAEGGTGTIYNSRYIGNEVRSNTSTKCYDGLHAVGRIVNFVCSSNTVYGRSDAGIAVNMIGDHFGYNFSVTGNTSGDNLVGVDLSGAKYGVVVGNSCKNTKDHSASNPCIRAISYNGSSPTDIIVAHNYAVGTHTSSGDVDIKIDSQGTSVKTSVHGNILKTFWTNAKDIDVTSNIFQDGATLNISSYSGSVYLGQNTFLGSFDFIGQGNPGLAGPVFIGKQKWNKSNPSNFLPNYSSSNPFWANYWNFDGDVQNILSSSFSTSSQSFVDIPGAYLVIKTPVIVEDIIAIADCQTHSGYVSISDMNNVEQCNSRFSVTAGTGGSNVICTLNSPLQTSNVYKVKLSPGVYKIRASSELNTLTIKSLSVSLWG